MREVDRRSKYNRRVFLQGAATAVPTVAIATSAGLGLTDAWAERELKIVARKREQLPASARELFDYLAAVNAAPVVPTAP